MTTCKKFFGPQNLNLSLQAARLDEGAPGRVVVREDLRELLHDVLEDVRRRLLEEGLQGRQVRALLDHRLQGALATRPREHADDVCNAGACSTYN